jgi:hypothetical protein
VDAYISEFQRIAVMVTDVSEHRLIMLFIEGLLNPCVVGLRPSNQDLYRMLSLEHETWST